MNLDEALAFCDRELEAKTGTALSELDKTIFRESWDGKTYQEIADSQHLSLGHVKNAGNALFKEISRSLQKVTKKSLRATFEQMTVDLLSTIGGDVVSDEIPQGEISTAAIPPFRVQLRDWFKTLKYEFEAFQTDEKRFFEWIIQIPGDWGGFVRMFVHGVEGEANIRDFEALVKQCQEQNTDRGLLVAVRRVSPSVKAQLAGSDEYQRRLICCTFDELIDRTADFTSYIEWLQKEIEQKAIAELYVPIATTKKEFDPVKKEWDEATYDESEGWTEGYINRWLDEESKQHISILVEFGTGKTWLVLHYAWTLLQEYLAKKAAGRKRPRLPLVIQLRDYSKALDLNNVLAGFFFSRHKIRLTAEIFEQLNRMGKLLLIFDGFDEMAARVDRQKMIDNFWELARVVVPGAKAVLTCRTEHFPDAQEGRQLLNAELQSSLSNVSGEPPQFEVLHLAPFTEEQIRAVLNKRATDEAAVERVLGDKQLRELAQRPLMSELILEALPEIEQGKPIDISRIYLYAVTEKMNRDIKAERTFTSLADKLYFLCEVSYEMLDQDNMSLNYLEFPARLRRLFGPVVQKEKELDHWRYDMMGQAMLIRDDDGNYKPAHRSLLEFFVAYKLAASLGVLAADFTAVAQAQACVDDSLSPQEYRWSAYFACEMAGDGRKQIAPLSGFAQESWDGLREALGEKPWAQAVLDLILPMVRRDAESTRRLQEVLQGTRGQTLEEVGRLGGNTATLLAKKNSIGLQNLDLSASILVGADLRAAWTLGTNFAGANLKDSLFMKPNLSGVNSVVFSPDEETFATGHSNGNIWIWRTEDGQALQLLQGHQNEVNSVRTVRTGASSPAAAKTRASGCGRWAAETASRCSRVISIRLIRWRTVRTGASSPAAALTTPSGCGRWAAGTASRCSRVIRIRLIRWRIVRTGASSPAAAMTTPSGCGRWAPGTASRCSRVIRIGFCRWRTVRTGASLPAAALTRPSGCGRWAAGTASRCSRVISLRFIRWRTVRTGASSPAAAMTGPFAFGMWRRESVCWYWGCLVRGHGLPGRRV